MPAENETLKNLWTHRLEQWQSSGLPVKKWCREQGICKPTFYYWRHKLMPHPKIPTSAPPTTTLSTFVELVDRCDSSISGVSIECRGMTIRLSRDFHQESLSSCLQVLWGI